ncbi:MAG: D-aminoacylase [Acidobacteria bacterium]|nr:MAG: D-aminoacylase [Acidobacteriota bacterium]
MTIRFSFILGATIAVAALIACSGNGPEPEPERAYDFILAGGRVVDGTGAPWFRADVGVKGDRIAAIGDLSEAPAESRIDATGLVIAPGFIDMLGQSEFNVLVDSRAASKITQGITTEVTGEGASIAPVNDRMMKAREPSYAHYGVKQDFRTLEEYFSRLRESPPAINIATFIGSGGIRDFVIGREDRRASPEELDEMKQMVARAMEAGALGLSASLQYVPDRFNSTDELVAMASVAAEYGGIYITHQRSEGNLIFESLDEVFEIAERAAIPAEVWHLKTAYKANWGKMGEVLERFEAARARGLDVTANQYPYIRASNGLHACLPVWVREGSTEEMLSRLNDASLRERIKSDMAADDVTEWENQWYGSGGAEGVMLSSVLNPELRKYEGKTMAQIGIEMGKDPRDALMDLVIADGGESSCIISIMNEEDVRTALKHPLVSVDTDSSARAEDGPFSETKSHPRAWGTFPRILGKYVREEGLLTLEEAIRKMTSRPAARVKLMDRGILRAGMAADITVFDPATIRDVATFEDPTHYSVGVRYVFVNGRAVVSEGEITDERPGRVLRGPGYRPTP